MQNGLKLANLLFIFSALATSTSAHAGDVAPTKEVDFSATWVATSSDYRTFGLNAQYGPPTPPEKTAPKWAVEGGWLQGRAQDLDFSYEKLNLKSGFALGRYDFVASVGVVNREAVGFDQQQVAVGSLSADHRFGKLSLHIEGGVASYGDVLQTAFSNGQLLHGPYWIGSASYRPFEKWRLGYTNHTMFISDGNRRSDNDLALMYAISPDWPWIWIGFGYELLVDSVTTNPYWSPRQFNDYGPRLDLSAPIYKKLSFALGFNLNWYTDIDFGSGTGYYGTARLVYGYQGQAQYSLGFESINSKQEESRWTSSAVSLAVSCPF